MNSSLRSITLVCIILISSCAWAQFPGKKWKKYANISESGFSEQKLQEVQSLYDQSRATSLLIVHNGHIVVSWGETERKFMTHSIRKSYLSALYGIYADKGKIDISRSMADLGIDDIQPLSDGEKQATIKDLLTARSGIYLPSAYSPRGMEKNLPPRGSRKPGEYWYYNNWDFNTLLTVFEQETGKKIFEEFGKRIAKPLNMEDYRIEDGYYRVEPERSQHAAYLFRMSARDMARFGLLYLNNGKWGNKQIVPADWVEMTTSPFTKDLRDFNHKCSFGHLWWISDGVNGEKMFYASGAGGHRIAIFPESNMVVVIRSNTYEGRNVSDEMVDQLFESIVAARSDQPSSNALLEEYDPEIKRPAKITLAPEITSKYLGEYMHPFLGLMVVSSGNKGLILENNVGIFRMAAVGENQFIPEDIETPVYFEESPDDDSRRKIRSVFGPNRSLEKVIFYY